MDCSLELKNGRDVGSETTGIEIILGFADNEVNGFEVNSCLRSNSYCKKNLVDLLNFANIKM